jgi:group II intron reverse transcriptase/maturase
MPLEKRGLHMVARCEETSAVHRGEEPVATKLQRIAEKARQEPSLRFNNLFYLMNDELLRGCFQGLNKNAAAGIDKVTKEKYAEDLDTNLANLLERLHKMAYIPQPVRRTYIPKPGSDKLRPLGVTCLEDKLVQAGLVRILEAVYEQDFIEDSYGFRPERSCHQALRALNVTIEKGLVNYIAEADIKGFFNNMDQSWIMKFLEHRIGDKLVLRMVKRFLKAGIVEDGELLASDEGAPQGGSISPLISSIYLHYALDLWFEKVFRKSCTGFARLIRFADDFVVCFQNAGDAERFSEELVKRLGKFNLEVEPTKTKVIKFGRFAAKNAATKGEKPETFDFLGFTHYCGTKRDGTGFRVKRKTASKKFTAKLAAFKEWLMEARTMKTKELWEVAKAKLRGHYAYYGVTDNSEGIRRFAHEAENLLFKWLNRRGKRGYLSWEKFGRMLELFPLPVSRIMVSMY